MGVANELSYKLKPDFFSRMRAYVCRWVSTCKICQQRKNPNQKAKAPLQSYLVGEVGERLCVDLMSPFSETDEDNHWILE